MSESHRYNPAFCAKCGGTCQFDDEGRRMPTPAALWQTAIDRFLAASDEFIVTLEFLIGLAKEQKRAAGLFEMSKDEILVVIGRVKAHVGD